MSAENKSTTDTMFANALGPASVVKTVLQMLLGAGLVVALILKVYMVVLTDYVCQADGLSLGNQIRCTTTLDLMASVLAISAGLEMALLFFVRSTQAVFGFIILAFAATILTVASDLLLGNFSWELALTLTAFAAATAGLCGLLYAFGLRDVFKTK